MSEVVEGTIDEVLEWVGDDPVRAQEAYLAEVEGKGRSTLLDKLDALANENAEAEAGETEPEAAAPQEVEAPATAGSGRYRALKRMHAQGVVYEPGDIVGPAATWSRVEGYVRSGWLEEVD